MRLAQAIPSLVATVLLVAAPAASQVTTDIVSESIDDPQITLPIQDLDGDRVFEIGEAHGTRSGANLFQSFRIFDLGTGDTALFTADPLEITNNIIGRVTGGFASQIDGTLATNVAQGAANLYLLNPSGIFFGPNATLDVQGSFHASTAHALNFEDGGGFTTRDVSPGVLSTASPSAFGFLDADIGAIQVAGSTLEVPRGATLSLIGGELTIEGTEGPYVLGDGVTLEVGHRGSVPPPGSSPFSSIQRFFVDPEAARLRFEQDPQGFLGELFAGQLDVDPAIFESFVVDVPMHLGHGVQPGVLAPAVGMLTAREGRILAAGVGGPGDVRLLPAGLGLPGLAVDVLSFAPVSIGNAADLRTDGPGAGRILIRGSDIEIVDSVFSAAGVEGGAAGEIAIQAEGELTWSRSEGGSPRIDPQGRTAQISFLGVPTFPAAVHVDLPTQFVAIVDADARGGSGGRVEIAGNLVSLDPNRIEASGFQPSEAGELGGQISVTAEEIVAGGALAASGEGGRILLDGGDIQVPAFGGLWAEQIELTGDSMTTGLLSRFFGFNEPSGRGGSGGRIEFRAGSIELQTLSTLLASGREGGEIVLDAGSTGSVVIDRATLDASGQVGPGGTIRIIARSFSNTGSNLTVSGDPSGRIEFGFGEPTTTQLIRDGSLGDPLLELEILDGDGDGVFEIGEAHGSRSGTNLFHSFERFDVGDFETALFTADPGLITTHVVSRVTGEAPSLIDGGIASDIEGADLYLLNPSGVFFGRNAFLDVPGAFYVSTAGSLRFRDGLSFLSDAAAKMALSSEPPEAFGFLGPEIGTIRVQGAGLDVAPGEALSLSARSVSFDRARSFDGAGLVETPPRLTAPSGLISVLAIRGAADVVPGEIPSFFGGPPRFGPITATGGTQLRVDGTQAGSIVMRGGSVDIDGTLSAAGDPASTSPGGSIAVYGSEIAARGRFDVHGFEGGGIVLDAGPEGTVTNHATLGAVGSSTPGGRGGTISLIGSELLNEGLFDASGFEGGRIVLDAGPSGSISNRRSLEARGRGGPGGTIRFLAGHILDEGLLFVSGEPFGAKEVVLGEPIPTQLIRDGSLGDPLLGLEILDRDGDRVFEIGEAHGSRSGANLFHSFERFDVGPFETALFTADPNLSTSHVVSRVTGGFPSQIDGGIASDIAGADLYLLNPSGVFFGRNAFLDVPGSFHVSTAGSLRFRDGVSFVSDAPAEVTLSSELPEAFGFLGPLIGSIGVEGAQLEVAASEGLSLVGGEIDMRASLFELPFLRSVPRLTAPGGRISLYAIGAAGDVPIAGGAAPVFRGDPHLGPITMSDGTRLVVDGTEAGSILVRGGTVSLDATLSAEGSFSVGGRGGSISVVGTEIVSLGELDVAGFEGGHVALDAGPLGVVTNHAAIHARGSSASGGRGGAISLVGSEIVNEPGFDASGFDGGQIVLDAGPSGAVRNQGILDVRGRGGRGGTIRLLAGELLEAGRFFVSGDPEGRLAIVLGEPTPTRLIRDGSLGDPLLGLEILDRDGDRVFEIGEAHGSRSGANLFHSFERFDVGPFETALFTADPNLSTSHVVSRVTGGFPSQIDGGIASDIAGADLYLLNPDGVFFGHNAFLDVKGSFHVSTAGSLRFQDQISFLSSAPTDVTVTPALPEAFGFLGAEIGSIHLEGSRLEVPSTEALSLAGGAIRLGEGLLNSRPTLVAPSGRIWLSSLGGAGEVPVTGESALPLDAGPGLGLIEVGGAGDLIVDGPQAGEILLRGGTVDVDGDLLARGSFSPGGRGGSISVFGTAILSRGQIDASGFEGGRVVLDAGAEGQVTNHARVRATGNTFAGGRGGSILVKGGEVLNLGTFDAGPLPGRVTVVLAHPLDTALIRDGSLGAPLVPLALLDGDGDRIYEIREEHGSRSGTNLFHSFEQFDLGTLDTALFTADPLLRTDNVITRVTGGLRSEIDGMIASEIPGAAFFFLNPHGMVFGPNAFLNVPNSFHASTADVLRLGDGEETDFVTAGAAPSPLGPGAPQALGFFDASPGSIALGGANLAVSESFTLSLVGGPLEIGAPFSAEPALSAGDIFAAAVAAAGDVVLGTMEVLGPRAEPGALAGFSPIVIDPGAELRADRLALVGSLTLEGRGRLSADTLTLVGDDIWIGGSAAAGSELLIHGNGITLQDAFLGVGSRGALRIFGESINLFDSGIDAAGFASRAGSIEIVGDHVGIHDSWISASGEFGGNPLTERAPGGSVAITADTLESTGSFILANAFGLQSAAGRISLAVGESVQLKGSLIGATGFGGGGGVIELGPRDGERASVEMSEHSSVEAQSIMGRRAGRIDFDVASLRLSDHALISAGTYEANTTQEGAIDIRARDFVEITGNGETGINIEEIADILENRRDGPGFSPVLSINADFTGIVTSQVFGGGTVAPIHIETGELRLSEGGLIESGGVGSGTSGRIGIEAARVVVSSGAQIDSSTFTGNGGDIEIRATESIEVSGSRPGEVPVPSRIRSVTASSGRAGDILLTAPEITVDGGALSTSNVGAELTLPRFFGPPVEESLPGSGQAGRIVIGSHEGSDVEVVRLVNGGRIEAGAFGTGPGGEVTIDASKSLRVEGTGSGIFSRATSDGAGGRVELEAPQIAVREGGTISTESGPGGFDESRAIFQDLIEQGIVQAPSGPARGHAGSIEVGGETAVLRLVEGSIRTDSSSRGDAGRISLGARVVDASGGSLISSSSTGTGRAGSVAIGPGTETLRLSDSRISTFAEQGPAVGLEREGNIAAAVGGWLLLEDGSSIEVSVRRGLGGSIEIGDPRTVVLREGSAILATTESGDGGSIEITAGAFAASAESRVSADAGVGNDGQVVINSPAVTTNETLARPEVVFGDPSARLQPSCVARAGSGSFTVARRRGLPVSPEGLLLAFEELEGELRVAGGEADEAEAELPPVGAAPPAGPVGAASQGALLAGALALRGGDFEAARTRLAEAASAGEGAARGLALRGLARSQLALGEYGDSIETLQRALREAEDSGDRVALASALGGLANAELARGNPDAALALFGRALELARASESAALVAQLLNNRANLEAARGEAEAALASYLEGARQASEGEAPLVAAQARANAARAALVLGRADEATQLLQEADLAIAALPSSHAGAALRIHLARSYEGLAATSSSQRTLGMLRAHGALMAALRQAEALGDERLRSLATGNLGALYARDGRGEEALYLARRAQRAAERADAWDLLPRWLYLEGKLLGSRGESEAALAAYRRAVELLEETRQESLARYGGDVDFRRALAPVYLDLVDALLQRGELREARDTMEQLKAAELRDYFRDECVAELEARRAPLEGVTERAAVVYPILLEDRVELLVSQPSGLSRYSVPVEAAQVRERIHRFRLALQDRLTRRYQPLAEALYDWLVRPYADVLAAEGVDTLVFVPDGALRTIPMAALHDGERFLVERFALAVTPGLTLVDPRPLELANARLLLAGVSQPRQVADVAFDALPLAAAELQAVHARYGGELWLDAAFETERLEQELGRAAPPSVVHLATHARFTGDPETSFIVTHDGRLTLDALGRAVEQSRFAEEPLELLVLSACETAAGDERAALGLAGVAVQAGARSALGTLWAVADEAAHDVIVDFYRELEAPGASKAQALAHAQRRLLARPGLDHPFFWSPYLLINNWL